MRRLLVNVYVYLEDGEDFFTVDKYKFYPVKTNVFKAKDVRRHVQNATVEFEGKQRDSILFKGGFTGSSQNPKKRKLLEDILLIGSLLGGTNWNFRSRINHQYPSSPVISHSYLENIGLQGKIRIEGYFKTVMNKIMDDSWQNQYENGFHLRMLFNRANIITEESRFLSNIVIWEWLYPHLTNPNQPEKFILGEILNEVMKYFWPEMSFTGQNIFQILRNQLAHSGKLPINRQGAETWMTQLANDNVYPTPGIKQYINFFDRLTQEVVLKTLGINTEIVTPNEIGNFLANGRLGVSDATDRR